MSDKPYYEISSTPSLEPQKARDNSWILFAFLVIFLHGFVPWLASFSTPVPKKQPRQKVLVQTIKLNPGAPPTTLLSMEEGPVMTGLEPAPLPPPPPPPEPEPIKKEELAPVAELPLPEKQQLPTPKPLPEVKKKPIPPKKPPEKKKTVEPAPKKVVKPTPPAPKKALPEPKPVQPDPQKLKREQEAKEAEAKRKAEQIKKEAEQKLKNEQAAKEAKLKKELAEKEAAEKTARDNAIRAKVQESLAKNKESRDKSSTVAALDLNKTTIPTAITSLQIDALPSDQDGGIKWSAKEVDYRDEVAHRLKATLRLPENGAVKVELTINKTGKVEKVKIISSESAKNKQYIERMLPTLQFPSFGNRFQDASQCTFSITLNNEN